MKILLCVSGGIAAYKTPELCRELQRNGHQVGVALTAAAQHFVAPLALKTLADQPLLTDIFADEREGIGHIALADWADLVLVAPATAETLAKLANGHASDPVSLSFAAATCTKLIFPAMNVNMWRAPATQRNVQRLRADGAVVIDPAEGELACGWIGAGRLPDLKQIVDIVNQRTTTKANSALNALDGKKILITAGPTREFIDPVRYISNPSTGKMGFALAEVAAKSKANVVLIAGPSALPTPPSVKRIDVVSANDMYEAVHQQLKAQSVEIFIAAAAVSDYAPQERQTLKQKKSADDQTLVLTRTRDVLASVTQTYDIPVVVGFAAETNDVIAYARAKLERKKLDLVVANDVSRSDAGFASDNNQVWLIDAKQHQELPLASKNDVAAIVLERVVKLWDDKQSGKKSARKTKNS